MQLQDERRRRGWRLRDVAERTARQASRLSEIETGKANSAVDNLVEAGDALGMKLVFVPDEKVAEVMALIGRVPTKHARAPSVYEELFIPDDDTEEPGLGHP